MKISLITIYQDNYGSTLQCLATQELFEKLGAGVEIVDYWPERYSIKGRIIRLKGKNKKFKNPLILNIARLIILPSYLKRRYVFNKFTKNQLNLTSRKYGSYKELEESPPKADVYCTGSDQTWNSLWNEGVDKTFFLCYAPENKPRVSYASSIGNSSISKEEAQEIVPYLKKYNYISVREDKGVELLTDLGISNVIQCLDPTLLLDTNYWINLIADKYKGKRYVVTYNLHRDPNIDKFAQSVADKYNLKIYNIAYNWHDIIRKGYLKWCPRVEDFLDLIKNATFVVADSFHATVFSLLFHTEFVSILPEEASSRIVSLLHAMGLDERACIGSPDISLLDNAINFEKTDKKLQELRNDSDNYLVRIIEEFGSN
ncbi:polysaccharide pyruvyl transferase family protein [Faecalimonas sp. LCP19S3_D12]